MKFTTQFALHSQTTRLFERASQSHRLPGHVREFHPLWYPIPRDLYLALDRKHVCRLQLRGAKRPDSKIVLFPLHSPLLRESLLVSFPPLINMLKFSGFPYLIWCAFQRIHYGFTGMQNLLNLFNLRCQEIQSTQLLHVTMMCSSASAGVVKTPFVRVFRTSYVHFQSCWNSTLELDKTKCLNKPKRDWPLKICGDTIFEQLTNWECS